MKLSLKFKTVNVSHNVSLHAEISVATLFVEVLFVIFKLPPYVKRANCDLLTSARL